MNAYKQKTAADPKHIYTKVLCGFLAVFLITVLGHYISYNEIGGSGAGFSGISCVSDSKAEIKAGDHVYFGSYPQPADGTAQPIEWRVLDIRDGKALMISEYLLDAHKYDSQSNEWENNELRAWLNDEFLNNAFAPEEREMLNGIEGDKVSLLTLTESRKYFSDNDDRIGITTAYARKNGADYSEGDNSGWWWLRSRGMHGSHASVVLESGRVYDYGNVIGYNDGCVRPVILASLSDEMRPVIS